MTIKTQAETTAMLRKVGFSRKKAKIAAAIAMCEAPIVTDGEICVDFGEVGDLELQTEKWGPSIGGFQVRSLKAELGTGTIRDAEWLAKPMNNCRAALAIQRADGWGQWSTYASGMYKAYLPEMFPPPEGVHVCVYGDTLSSIAAANGTSWEELARINGLHAPYTIYIGQQIRLHD